ncbi:MAG: DUF3987 domain-containing protein [Phycisphaera sp. RhM]|nr:DUF3987 domain-containing protein [Phycisphaera sp. RhM]
MTNATKSESPKSNPWRLPDPADCTVTDWAAEYATEDIIDARNGEAMHEECCRTCAAGAMSEVVVDDDATRLFELLYSRCNDSHGDIFLLEKASKISHRFRAGEWRLAAAQVAASNPKYYKYNLQDGSQVGANEVGRRGTVKTVVAFGIDVDAGKGDFHSRDHVLEKLNEMPVAPTAIINTRGEAGGFHCYWVLESPHRIEGDDDRDSVQSAAKRWEDHLRGILDGRLDTTSNLDRMLRPAGSHRTDGENEPVEIYVDDGAMYSLDDLTLPEPAPPQPKSEPASPITHSGETSGSDFQRNPAAPGVIATLMESLGYKVWQAADGYYRFNRPGSETKMANGKFGDASDNGVYQLVSYTPNAPFEVNKSITIFQAYCDLLHGGDHSAGASALYESGYGTREDEGDVEGFEMPEFVSRLIKSATAVAMAGEEEELSVDVSDYQSVESTTQIDADLIYDGGFIGDWVRHVEEGASYSGLEELYLSSAMFVLSAAAARRYHDDSSYATRSNLYLVNVAESGQGKDRPLTCIKKLLDAAGDDSSLDEFGSDSGLYAALETGPVNATIDECGDFFATTTDSRAGAWKTGIVPTLKKIYTHSNKSITSPMVRGREKVVIQYPHLSVWGCTTGDQMAGAFSEKQTLDGLVGRLCFFAACDPKRVPRSKRSTRQIELPGDLLSAYVRLAGIGVPCGPASVSVAANKRDPIETPEWRVIPRSLEAENLLEDYYDDLAEESDAMLQQGNSALAAVTRRADEKCAKFAMVYMLSRVAKFPQTVWEITEDDAEKAIRLTEHLRKRMASQIRQFLSDDREADALETMRQLHRLLLKNKSQHVSGTALRRRKPLFGNVRADMVLKQLEQAGYITSGRQGRGIQIGITDSGLKRLGMTAGKTKS